MRGWQVEIYLGSCLFILLLLRTALHANRLFRHEFDARQPWDYSIPASTGRDKEEEVDYAKALTRKRIRQIQFDELMTPDGDLYNTTTGMKRLIDHINDYSRCTHRAIPPLRGRKTKNASRTVRETAQWKPDEACMFDPGDHAERFSNLYTCSIGDVKITIPKVPSFVIIGAQKGGTTSMFNYLMEHPNVRPSMNSFLSNGMRHEVHFFDFEWRALEQYNSLQNKSDFYCHVAKRYVEINFDVNAMLKADLYGRTLVSFDKTPRYILRPNIPAKLKKTCPWITKLIAVLRNPVDRAFSEFNMDSQRMISVEETPHSFDKAVREELMHLQENGLVRESYDFSGNNIPGKIRPPGIPQEEEERIFTQVEPQKPRYIKRGMYAIQLESWAKEYVIHDNLLVLNSDKFHHGGERETFLRVLRHVGLPDYHKDEFDIVHQRSYKFGMLNSTRELLEKFYRPYNSRLPGILGEEWEGVWMY
mmetsp:Transcript_15442/g.33583  ORF Transcript_15442/g.33583 Transcript_15442/m.33583 type:complete len:475 (+) Transcript_15442:53-1477(+)